MVLDVEMSGGTNNQELSVSLTCSRDCSSASACMLGCGLEEECVVTCMERHNCTQIERNHTRLRYEC